MIDLSVIIVNYNTADFLPSCLKAIFSQTGPSFEVWVVDNGSTDQSVSLIREQFPQVNLIASPENLGFARANNLAVLQASGRFIYYLNPDTEVQPGCFAAMLCFMEDNQAVGMAGTRLLYPDRSHQNSVEKTYPGQQHAHNELSGLPGNIAWLLGASLIVREIVVQQVGGFSEAFFLYGEDIDLGIKVRQAGWQLGYIANAEVIHWEGKSERTTLPIEVVRKKLAALAILYQRYYSAVTILRICRANIRQARWRLLTLAGERLFHKDKTMVNAKRERYRLSLTFFQKLAATTSRT